MNTEKVNRPITLYQVNVLEKYLGTEDQLIRCNQVNVQYITSILAFKGQRVSFGFFTKLAKNFFYDTHKHNRENTGNIG